MNANYRWVRDELARYTYKPDFTMEALPPRMAAPDDMFADLIEIRFTMLVPDSRREVPTGRMKRKTPVIVAAFDPADLDMSCSFEWEMERPIIPVTGTRIVDKSTIGHPDLFGAWLMWQLDDFERHETREWLRRDGDLVDDPHAPAAVPATIKVDAP